MPQNTFASIACRHKFTFSRINGRSILLRAPCTHCVVQYLTVVEQQYRRVQPSNWDMDIERLPVVFLVVLLHSIAINLQKKRNTNVMQWNPIRQKRRTFFRCDNFEYVSLTYDGGDGPGAPVMGNFSIGKPLGFVAMMLWLAALCACVYRKLAQQSLPKFRWKLFSNQHPRNIFAHVCKTNQKSRMSQSIFRMNLMPIRLICVFLLRKNENEITFWKVVSHSHIQKTTTEHSNEIWFSPQKLKAGKRYVNKTGIHFIDWWTAEKTYVALDLCSKS